MGNRYCKKSLGKYRNRKMIKSYHWVLLEHNIKYILPSYLNDKILLKTYIDDTTRIKSKGSRVL